MDVPGIVQLRAHGVNMGQAPYRPDTQLWADSGDLWIGDGHGPLLRRVGPDGVPRETLWLDLEREPVRAADREAFLDHHARSGQDDPEIIARRRAMAESFEFPGMKPFYYEAHPMDGEVWLRVSDEPRGRGSRWLVVDPHAAQARMLAELPEGTRPLSSTPRWTSSGSMRSPFLQGSRPGLGHRCPGSRVPHRLEWGSWAPTQEVPQTREGLLSGAVTGRDRRHR